MPASTFLRRRFIRPLLLSLLSLACIFLPGCGGGGGDGEEASDNSVLAPQRFIPTENGACTVKLTLPASATGQSGDLTVELNCSAEKADSITGSITNGRVEQEGQILLEGITGIWLQNASSTDRQLCGLNFESYSGDFNLINLTVDLIMRLNNEDGSPKCLKGQASNGSLSVTAILHGTRLSLDGSAVEITYD